MTTRAPTRIAVLIGPFACAAAGAAGELDVRGVAAGRGIAVESREAWIDGGFGRLTEGESDSGFVGFARAEAHLGLEWTAAGPWQLRLHGTARTEPGAAGGWRAGLTEAFVQYRTELRPDLALRFRAGLQFPPTSRENVDPLWQSPYTLTPSALNSWIGEELRPIGLDGALAVGETAGSRFELAGMGFLGADTAGALLAWRGWAMGTRLAVAGETLPLPPLPTLAARGGFADQLDAGTRPIDELDGRIGWHARARWSRAGRGLLQAAWTDTRGDRALHEGQYSWATRFASLAAEVEVGRLRLVAEAMGGDTGMGLASGPHVDLRLRAAYALASWASPGEAVRISARYDRFRNDDRDGVAEPNQESGWALTLSALAAPRPWLRVGVEYLELRGDRPAAEFAGSSKGAGGRRAQLELRLRF